MSACSASALCSASHSEGSFSLAANETLESLCDKFNELFEEEEVFESADNTLADGVLTALLGESRLRHMRESLTWITSAEKSKSQIIAKLSQALPKLGNTNSIQLKC